MPLNIKCDNCNDYIDSRYDTKVYCEKCFEELENIKEGRQLPRPEGHGLQSIS